MAIPVFADGGPHVVPNNNGTGTIGLAGDCAGCHRAHRGQAADLLKATMPALCLSCHDGTGSTVNVVDGVQYVPASWTGTPATDSVLGALRGGGFEYALLKTGDPSRLNYNRSGGARLTYGALPASGSVTLTWSAFATPFVFAGGSVTFNGTDSSTTIQTAVDALFGTSTTYSGSTSLSYQSGLPLGNRNVIVSKSTDNLQVNFAFHNAWRTLRVALPTVTANTLLTGAAAPVSATLSDTTTVSATARVGVLATGEAATSTHMGEGTVWGNGAMGSTSNGATGVELTCTSCHNPHGNGQYRILLTEPGEDWTNDFVEATTTLTTALTTGTDPIHVASAASFPDVKFYIKVDSEIMYVTGGQGTLDWNVTRGAKSTTAAAHSNGATVSMIIADWTAPTNEVEVIDGPELTGSQVRNYTVLPGALTSDVVSAGYTATQGDYLRRKYDPTGAANWTNFYLIADPMTIGWNGQSPTNATSVGSGSTTLTAALSAPSLSSTATTATVASTAIFPNHLPAAEPQPMVIIKIDSELLTASWKVTSGAFVANQLTVSRGYGGTTPAAHLSGATVSIVSSDPEVDPTNASLYNRLGRMTAWCIQCHTRYNGWAQNGTSSLNAQTPSDATFNYKHGTTGIGCLMCHVNHGTNATMTGLPTTSVTFPDGTPEDSALLKVNNRGLCQLCHDPTESLDPGVTIGTVPGAITPGP